MKILVVGFDGAVSQSLLGDETLHTIHRLAEVGCYGWLANPSLISGRHAWLSLLTGQDVSGRDSSSFQPTAAIWGPVIAQGRQAIVTGWLPAELSEADGLTIRSLAGDHAGLSHEMYSASRRQFEQISHLLLQENWAYFQFIETGLGNLERTGQGTALVRDYLRHLDTLLEGILEALPQETALLIIFLSDTPAEPGFFVLAAANSPLSGEVEAAHLADLAPTLLELAGYNITEAMGGRSLLASAALDVSPQSGLSADDEEILRERLSGLGYIE
jgi:hypothetical protein